MDLANSIGLEDARVDDAWTTTYAKEVFQFAVRRDTAEAEVDPSFVDRAIRKIRLLRELMKPEDPPGSLVEAVQTASAELIEFLRRHPEELNRIRPRQFEELVAEILSSYGWEVQLTPPTNDGGYDLFAVSSSSTGDRSTWIVECKKWERNVGVDVARAVYGVKSQLNVDNAMLATTSDFTRGVKAFKTSVWNLELRNYENMLEWINAYRPCRPTQSSSQNREFWLPGRDV